MSEEKLGFFARLKAGLAKTRNSIVRGIDAVFSGFSSIDDEFFEELEEILIMGDIGVSATNDILERLKEQIKEKHYVNALKDYRGKILLVGINYNKTTKKHECIIENIQK